MDSLRKFLEEDVRSGDVTTDLLVSDVNGKADIICESDAVTAGLEEAAFLFTDNGIKCELHVKDGTRIGKGTVVMTLSGPLKKIITVERTALNLMMRMSGISTATDDVLNVCRKVNEDIKISGTRKTAPGLRYFDKKAIALGGGDPHRYGLDDAVLVKDNHIKAAGGMENVIRSLKSVPFTKKIEVEVENINDAVIATGCADIIMIDNVSPSKTREIAEAVKKKGDIVIEVSGNITKENVTDYAKLVGLVDIISMGSLTHSVHAIHFSLNVK